jgi:hypothetical protein
MLSSKERRLMTAAALCRSAILATGISSPASPLGLRYGLYKALCLEFAADACSMGQLTR